MRKPFGVLLVVLALFHTGLLPGVDGAWTDKTPSTDMPPGIDFAQAVSVGSSVYMFGGVIVDPTDCTETVTGSFFQLDTSSETSTEIFFASGPSPRVGHCMVTDGVDLIFVLGGELSGGSISTELWQFSISSSTWTELSAGFSGWNFPPTTDHGCHFVTDANGNFIYAFGGFVEDGSSTLRSNVLRRFDTNTDPTAATTWFRTGSAHPDMVPRAFGGARGGAGAGGVVGYDNQIWVVGGEGDSGVLNEIWRFSVGELRWTQLENPPSGSIVGSASVTLLSPEYLILFNGRRGNAEDVCETHEYSVTECNAIGCCEVDDGECWSAVGDSECGAYQNTEGVELMQYSFAEDKWVDITHQDGSLPARPNGGQAITAMGMDRIFVYGGETSTAASGGTCNTFLSDVFEARCFAAAGEFCEGLWKRDCPEGFFCTGGDAPPAPCTVDPGQYCPIRSTSDSGTPCPEGFFCDGGSAPTQDCTSSTGFYCAVGSSDPAGTICPVGHYCVGGSNPHVECTAEPGYYCDEGSSDPAGEVCPEEYYCEGGGGPEADKQPCTVTGGLECREGTTSAAQLPCRIGYYCSPTSSQALGFPCTAAPGHYCPESSEDAAGVTCPAGHYCFGSSQNRVACNSPAGTYCPPQSAIPTNVECPAGRYCPGGSSNAIPCNADPGHYCDAGATNVDAAQECPVGYYCRGGFFDKVLCTVDPGYYCPARTSTPDGSECPLNMACAGGSAPAVDCVPDTGYYCPPRLETPSGYPCPPFGAAGAEARCGACKRGSSLELVAKAGRRSGSESVTGQRWTHATEHARGSDGKGGRQSRQLLQSDPFDFGDPAFISFGIGASAENINGWGALIVPENTFAGETSFYYVRFPTATLDNVTEIQPEGDIRPAAESTLIMVGASAPIEFLRDVTIEVDVDNFRRALGSQPYIHTRDINGTDPFVELCDTIYDDVAATATVTLPTALLNSVQGGLMITALYREQGVCGNAPPTTSTSSPETTQPDTTPTPTTEPEMVDTTPAPEPPDVGGGRCSDSELATFDSCQRSLSMDGLSSCSDSVMQDLMSCQESAASSSFGDECAYFQAVLDCYDADECLCSTDDYASLWSFVQSLGCSFDQKCPDSGGSESSAEACNAFLVGMAACEPACLCSDSGYLLAREQNAAMLTESFGCTIRPGCGAAETATTEQSVKATEPVELKSFSISFWMAKSTATGRPGVILAHQEAATGGVPNEFFIINKGAGRIRLEFSSSDFAEWDVGTSIADSTNWAHWVFTYGATSRTVKLFRNGLEVTSADGVERRTVTKSYDARGDVFIGSPEVAERDSIQGVMLDEIALYSRALTDEEVAGLTAGGIFSIPNHEIVLRFDQNRSDSKFELQGDGMIYQTHCNYNRDASLDPSDAVIIQSSDLLEAGCWGFREHADECPNVINASYCMWVMHAVVSGTGSAQCPNRACEDIVSIKDDPEFLLAVNLTDLIFQGLSLLAAIWVVLGARRGAAEDKEVEKALPVTPGAEGGPPGTPKANGEEEEKVAKPTRGKALPKQLNWVFCIIAFVLSCLEMQKILGSDMHDSLERLETSYCFFDQDNMDPNLPSRMRSEFRSIRICAPFKLVFVVLEMFTVFNMDTETIIYPKPAVDLIQCLISAIDFGFTVSLVVRSEDIYDLVNAVTPGDPDGSRSQCSGGGDNYWCFCATNYCTATGGDGSPASALQPSLLATMLLGVLAVAAVNAMGRRRLF